MKKLGRIHKFGLAGLSALALATPVALAQTGSNEQGGQTAVVTLPAWSKVTTS